MKYGLRKTIQFSPEMWEEIRKRAFKLKISPSEFIRLCIEEHMVKRACLSTFNEEEWKSRDKNSGKSNYASVVSINNSDATSDIAQEDIGNHGKSYYFSVKEEE